MGLTKQSVGMGAITGIDKLGDHPDAKVIALAGNPNVGKSTLFNSLTGMNQHTGNWPGKTVASAAGGCESGENKYVLVDIPGTYSLFAHSAEEEVARDFICFGGAVATVVVCDATCLERNLNLVLQTAEISPRTVVCVNLMDEAKRKGIEIDTEKLSERLGLPVVAAVARKKQSLAPLLRALDDVTALPPQKPYSLSYPPEIERAVMSVRPVIEPLCGDRINSRWMALRLIENDVGFISKAEEYLGIRFSSFDQVTKAAVDARSSLLSHGITPDKFEDALVGSILSEAERVCAETVTERVKKYSGADRKADRILTGRLTAYPTMLILLAVIFWLTVSGANYPSQILSKALFSLQDVLDRAFIGMGAPDWLRSVIVHGAYRVLAWVVSVMLPPMAIFFPLFTLLEDAGYLPRVAYNLDRPFSRCDACGKQALTMCMGFGCNAAGVVGCRIIDSPRERLLAVLTNSFVPCNGRFPLLIAMISMFFIVGSGGGGASLLPAIMLTGFILLGITVTFAVTKLLSVTLLKGTPSSFTLEMPPYRRPQIWKVIVRSVFDRTLFVLGRAAAVAAPAGAVIWIMANVEVGGVSLLTACSDFLDPFARVMGLDGVILLSFILGFPANEIVLPIILMAYTAQGSLPDITSVTYMRDILVANGWTALTAACTVLFSLMHWPCSTTLLTVKKETGSLKWTVLSAVIPTVCGMICCILLNFAVTFFNKL